ncbi:MAG: TIGR02710 family CRISPR-associated CARF protein [Deltaproteobacteria bacterium]|nr:TIGR02710 family CRISPR-associated CARF protein [Deltaproteobacteria bacterium]
MKTILIITVGGSHEPIVASAKQDGPNKPDFVHFLCSADWGKTKGSYMQVEGPGMVNKSHFSQAQPDLPNIITLAGLSAEQCEVHKIEHFDDLDECYLTSLRLMERLHQEHPDARLIADYTGGTKSMTAGLAAAALDDRACEIRLVAGLRQNTEKVTSGTHFARPAKVWNTQVERRMRSAQGLIERFDYAAAARLLEDTAANFASEETISQLQRWLTLCRAFDAWDRFEHGVARSLLQPYRSAFVPYAIFLDQVTDGEGYGFELVEDLLLNAKRRAAQRRFDDSVGRLYRAVELTAQVWLKTRHGIDAAHVDIKAVPEIMKARIDSARRETGPIKISLLLAWDVIAALPGDSLGAFFEPQRSKVMDFLTLRNFSLFAHGLRPITEHDYNKTTVFVEGFVQGAIDLGLAALGKKRKSILHQLPIKWE